MGFCIHAVSGYIVNYNQSLIDDLYYIPTLTRDFPSLELISSKS